MKKMVLLLFVLSSCRAGYDEGNVLYKDTKCVVIRVNDSTLIIAPGINSANSMEAKVVFINVKTAND